MDGEAVPAPDAPLFGAVAAPAPGPCINVAERTCCRTPSSESSNSSGRMSRIGRPSRSKTVTSMRTPAVVVPMGGCDWPCASALARASRATETACFSKHPPSGHIICHSALGSILRPSSPPFDARRTASIGLTGAAVDLVLLGGRDGPVAPAPSTAPGQLTDPPLMVCSGMTVPAAPQYLH